MTIKHLTPRSSVSIKIAKFLDFFKRKPKALKNIEFVPKWSFNFQIGIGSYFDSRVMINTSITQLISLILLIPAIILFSVYSLFLIPFLFFGWGKIYWHLPIQTKYDISDPPEYGYYFYNESSSFWLCLGEKKKSFDMPWSWDWHRTSGLVKSQSSFSKDPVKFYCEDSWVHETKGNNLAFYKDIWDHVLWSEEYPYKYTLKGGVEQKVIAKIRVVEREWRRKWLPKTKLFNMVRKTIDVKFDGEVGERAGSWKGGCTGCGYNMLPDEKPEDTLRRMEKERKF